LTYFQRTGILIAVALVAYALPWVNHTGTPLTMGAYDLAEWASIHPVARISSPTMLVSLLLRLPLALLAIIIGFAAPAPPLRTVGWWAALIAILIITMSSLPPLEFFTGSVERNDPNYQQQFYLTLAALIGGCLGLTGLLPRVRPFVVLVAALAAIFVSLDALGRVDELMDWVQIETQLGVGMIVFVGMSLLLAVNAFAIGIKKQRAA